MEALLYVRRNQEGKPPFLQGVASMASPILWILAQRWWLIESWAELWIKDTGSGLGTLGKNSFLGLLGEKMAFLLVKYETPAASMGVSRGH